MIACSVGCALPPLDEVCPQLGEGDLVLTEVSQSEAGTLGQWLELYNAAAEPIDLEGLQIEQVQLDGTNARLMYVREPVELAPGAYAALGRGQTDAPPAHLEYAFGNDLVSEFHTTGLFRVRACDSVIDSLEVANIPGEGTFALDGAQAPDADAEMEDFCNDVGDHGEIPGTPGEANPPCT